MHTSEGLELESGSGSGSCIGDLPNCRPATKGNLSGPANRVGRVRLWHPQDIARAQPSLRSPIQTAAENVRLPPAAQHHNIQRIQAGGSDKIYKQRWADTKFCIQQEYLYAVLVQLGSLGVGLKYDPKI